MMLLLCPPPVNSDQSHDRLKADISVCLLSVFQRNLLSRSAKPKYFLRFMHKQSVSQSVLF